MSERFDWMKYSEGPPWWYRWYATLQSGRGGVGITLHAEVHEWDFYLPYEPGAGWTYQGHSMSAPALYPEPLGPLGSRESPAFGFWFKWERTADFARRELIVPYWFLAALTAALPTLWILRRLRERRRMRAGLCPQCGYDLRASTEKCPECGAATASAWGMTNPE